MTRGRALVHGALVVATAAAFLTARDYGIASDVAVYFHSSLRQIAWASGLLDALADGSAGEMLTRARVLEHWRWLPDRVVHPPLSRELGGLSWLALRGWLDPLTAYRGAALLAYGALVASLAGVVRGWTGSGLAGAVAAGAALVTPALFAHGHFAHTDLLLAALWFWGAAAAEAYRRSGDDRWLVGSGLLLGAACATKFTGLLLAPVILVWLGAQRRLDARATALLAASAAVVFFAVDPALWVDPAGGVREYVAGGVERSAREAARIHTEYFGRLYPFRAPWHYPFVWTVIVLPIPILAAVAVGLAEWRRVPLVRWAVLNLAVVYAALLLPAAPLHDGIRLFLPVFPFVCALAGVGTAAIAARLARLPPLSRATPDLSGALAAIAVLALPAYRTAEYHPHQLSYFNALIGGVRGAAARGLEVTNLKEAFGPAVLADVREYIPDGAVVHGGFLTEELCFYQAVGDAPAGWVVETGLRRPDGEVRTIVCESPPSLLAVAELRPPREPDFAFVFHRRTQYTELDLALARFGGPPLYALSVQGVPILALYRTR